MKLETIREIKAYYKGKRDGIWEYAWWKDGIQYVGTSGKMFLAAQTELTHLENDTCVASLEGKEIWV